MKKFACAALLSLLLATSAHAAPPVGQPAPDFTGTDTKGVAHHLADYKGKIVVLEWTNPQCPYVKKHYGTGNMQAMQKEMTGEGVVWLSVASSAKGREGYMDAEESNAYMKESGAAETARIIDADGKIGRLYGATTTPDMYVIDKAGVLAYAGAIDDKPITREDTVKEAHNYVRAAVADLKAGKPVAEPLTQAYGCGVKYAE